MATTVTPHARFRASFVAFVVLLLAAACGSSATDTVNASYSDQLDEQAERALDPAPAQAEPEPVQAGSQSTQTAPATPVAVATTPPATPAAQEPAAVPTEAPAATATAPPAAQPTVAPVGATASTGTPYDGVLPAWFSIPTGFAPTGADLQTSDIDVLTVTGSISTSFTQVCAQFADQARIAGLPVFAGTCASSSVIYGTENQTATAQSFGRTTGEFIFIGFDLVPGGNAAGGTSSAATDQFDTAEPPASTVSGVFPAWYQPPSAISYISHRDGNDGTRRVQTDLVSSDYIAVCNDFRDQAAQVGLLPTTSKQCDDPVISWTTVEGPTGADSEIQRLDGLSYDVLFVFDSASMRIGGGGSTAAPSAAPEAPAAAEPEVRAEGERRILPGWFQPTVEGTDLTHAIENGVYQLVATGEISSGQTFIDLCLEFEQQGTTAGWIRVEGDVCGEDIFDGATLRDPATGFEAQVRNFRGNQITYAFQVGVDLTPAEVTAISFDPELDLVPTGFSLVPGDMVIAVAEGIDNTGAYTSSLQISGPSTFVARCERLVSETPTAFVVLGSCDADSDLLTLRVDDTTVLLEGDVYVFVTR